MAKINRDKYKEEWNKFDDYTTMILKYKEPSKIIEKYFSEHHELLECKSKKYNFDFIQCVNRLK